MRCVESSLPAVKGTAALLLRRGRGARGTPGVVVASALRCARAAGASVVLLIDFRAEEERRIARRLRAAGIAARAWGELAGLRGAQEMGS